MFTKYNRKGSSYFSLRKSSILNNTLKDSKLIIKATRTIIVYSILILLSKISKLIANIIIVLAISSISKEKTTKTTILFRAI